jgi:predicted RND superfamily exporter protein
MKLLRPPSRTAPKGSKSSSIVFDRFGILADWIVDHRWTTFVLIVMWTTLMAIGHYDPYIILSEPPPPYLTAESDDDEAPRGRLPNVAPLRVADGDVIVVAHSDEFFTPEGSAAIRDAVDAIQGLPQVTGVLWMDQAPPLNIFGLQEPIFPKRNVTQSRLDRAKERSVNHPMVGGQLLSADGKTMLLMVTIEWLFVTKDSDCTDLLRDTAAAAVAKHPGVEIDFKVTGDVPIRISREVGAREKELKYQAIGYSMAALIAFVLFRGLSAVVIVSLAPIFGVFWTLGLLHYLDLADNPFNSVIVPVLLCMVGFTDGVHMMVQIRRHRAAGMSPTDAARQSIREVGVACWLTSLTTAIGFGSLMLANHEEVREFGMCCVIGVLMTFISVITLIPLACASPLGRRVHTGYGKNLVDRNLDKISVIIDFVLARPNTMSIVAISATAILGLMTLQLRPDERRTSALAGSSEPAIALAHIDKAFGGMDTSEVRVNWDSSVESTDGEIAEVVQQVDAILDSEPLIGHPLSIARMLDALPGEGEPAARMSMLELLPPPLKRAYFTPEQRNSRVSFRLQDIGIASYGPVFQRIEQKLAVLQSEHPEFELKLGGGAVYRWKNLFQVVTDLVRSLGTASFIIFAVMTVAYRSLRLGLISVIPNVFPLVATGSLLYAIGQNLEMVSVCAFTVCLGIAVDDTIHFLTRYKEELTKTNDRHEAIRKAFIGVGTALVMTTIVMVIGFAAVYLSDDARDHKIFTMMGILTVSTALFADLVFLPALLIRFGKNERLGDSSESDIIEVQPTATAIPQPQG